MKMQPSNRPCVTNQHSTHSDEAMRETISISVPEEIKNELDEAVREEGLSRSDLVRQALREFLFIRRFRKLRSSMMVRGQAHGVFTDEDVFDQVS